MSDHPLRNEAAYDLWAATYDTALNSTTASDDVAFPPLWAHLKNSRVLEIGPGTGRHTLRLLQQGNTVVGVDVSTGMLAKAKVRLQAHGLWDEGKVKFIHGDVTQVPSQTILEKGPFDAAVCALVVEHIADLHLFFGTVAQYLRNQSSIYLSEIHPSRAKKGRLAHFVSEKTGDEVWLEGSAHADEDYLRAAKAAGFALISAADGLGHPNLVKLNPEWTKYVGAPMVRLWEFRLSKSF